VNRFYACALKGDEPTVIADHETQQGCLDEANRQTSGWDGGPPAITAIAANSREQALTQFKREAGLGGGTGTNARNAA
jgi:hypothetical protein